MGDAAIHSQHMFMLLDAAARRGSAVVIRYTNADGAASERKISCVRLFHGRNGNTYVSAFCHAAGEVRTFRSDRIAEVLCDTVVVLPAKRAEQAAEQPVPEPEVARSDTAEMESDRRYDARRRVKDILAICFMLLVLDSFTLRISWQFFGQIWSTTRMPGSPVSSNTDTATGSATTSPTQATPDTQILRYRTYRGYQITEELRYGRRMFVPEGMEYVWTLYAAKDRIARELFRKGTGIRSFAVENFYFTFDTDQDSVLSWDEIRNFQATVFRSFTYRSNESALRPDQFMAAGGGDCDDFALFSCGFLRYFGYTAYLGIFTPGNGTPGHAIAFLYSTTEPTFVNSFSAAQLRKTIGKGIPDGYFVPIDYDQVGKLSASVGAGWYADEFYVPESVYGSGM